MKTDTALDSSHEPCTRLLHVGEVVIGVVGEIVGLEIDAVAGMRPLDFHVEGGVGAVGLSLTCLGIVELAFTVFEGDIPLRRESADDAMMERSDKFVVEEGHA